jgi:hypothetical protein
MKQPKKEVSRAEREKEFLGAPARYLNTLAGIQDRVGCFV